MSPSIATVSAHPDDGQQRRVAHAPLLLTEINPHTVIDALPAGTEPVDLHSFGTVREACPKCQGTHLHLILRQSRVRVAHLLCADCHSCYDAHYAGGAPALSL